MSTAEDDIGGPEEDRNRTGEDVGAPDDPIKRFFGDLGKQLGDAAAARRRSAPWRRAVAMVWRPFSGRSVAMALAALIVGGSAVAAAAVRLAPVVFSKVAGSSDGARPARAPASASCRNAIRQTTGCPSKEAPAAVRSSGAAAATSRSPSTAGAAAPATVFTASISTIALDMSPAAGPSAIAVGDIDGRATPDVAAVGRTNALMSFQLNDGHGGFSAGMTPERLGLRAPAGVAVGDLNGDGKPDVAITDASTGGMSVYRGLGTGAFTSRSRFEQGATTSLTGTSGNAVAICDLNGDGRLDIVVVNAGFPTEGPQQAAGNVRFFVRSTPTGPGTTTAAADYAETTIDLGLTGPNSVAVGDLDGDGDTDLAVGAGAANAVELVSKTGPGTAASDYAVTSVPAGRNISPASIAIGDLNDDGRPDLATADDNAQGVDGTVSIFYKNPGAGYRAAPKLVSAPGAAQTSGIALGDLNGDGRLDIVAVNRSDGPGSLSVFLEDATGRGFARTVLPDDGGPTTVAIADITGDGAPDIVAGDVVAQRLSVFDNTTAQASTKSRKRLPSRHEGDSR